MKKPQGKGSDILEEFREFDAAMLHKKYGRIAEQMEKLKGV